LRNSSFFFDPALLRARRERPRRRRAAEQRDELAALVRAFRWRRLLDEGTCGTIKDIAAKENIDPSYVGDVLQFDCYLQAIVFCATVHDDVGD
jgi:hypothetical protein